MMKILVAPNSFKECASSVSIADLITRRLCKYGFVSATSFPVSDGGDNFLDVCRKRLGVEFHSMMVHTCFNRSRKRVPIGYDRKKQTVYIESAKIIGLNDIPKSSRKPMHMNSAPLGEIIQRIMAKRENEKFPVKKIVIGIGGTGTNDLGLGLCSLFGLILFNAKGLSMPVLPEYYVDAKIIALPKRVPLPIDVVLDVSVPLTGKDGPSLLFSRQKGASSADATLMEQGTKNILHLLKKNYFLDYIETTIGAGGGMSLGLSLLSTLKIVRSKVFLNTTLGLSDAIKKSDVIITGEGNFDRQSTLEKATGVVLREAAKNKKKVFLIVGKINASDRRALPKNVVPIELNRYFTSTEESIRNYRNGIHLAVDEIVRALSPMSK
jgi:glycerate kinase